MRPIPVANGSAVRGFETYFLATARTEDERRVAEMENDVVRFETETEARRATRWRSS
jgi:N-acetylmuramoyl-L-alanine amidase